MLGIAWIMRIAGLMQGAFNEQIAGLVAGSGAANRIAALDDQNLASLAGKDRARRQAAQTGADYYYVILRHFSAKSSKTLV